MLKKENEEGRIISLEENKAIIRRLFEAENKRNLSMLDELIALDFVDERNTPFELRGPEGYKQFVNVLFKGFPDWHETIEDIIAEGDKVCVHMNVTATHTGEYDFFGVKLAPTGKKITYAAVNFWRVVDGKVVERKSVRDLLVFLTQLGLIAPTEKGKQLFPSDV
jgi:C-1 hydroxylase